MKGLISVIVKLEKLASWQEFGTKLSELALLSDDFAYFFQLFNVARHGFLLRHVSVLAPSVPFRLFNDLPKSRLRLCTGSVCGLLVVTVKLEHHFVGRLIRTYCGKTRTILKMTPLPCELGAKAQEQQNTCRPGGIKKQPCLWYVALFH